MEFLVEIVKGFPALTIFAINPVLDVWKGPTSTLRSMAVKWMYITILPCLTVFWIPLSMLIENCLNMQPLVQVSVQNQQLKQSKTNAFIAFLIFLEATVAIWNF